MNDANDHPSVPHAESSKPGGIVDATRFVALYESHGPELRRFILGVTRDPELTNDVIQATYTKAVEFGHTARAETFKGWLFRVAFHEALTARRRRDARDQGVRRLADLGGHAVELPDEQVIRDETIEAVRQALGDLPPEQRRVVWARMYEDKTFAEIAQEYRLPLGTVLTRMRLALEKLRRSLRPGD
ncbi:RNA polymerase sigma factor [Singulisphaera acidiphila]|uniref:RNA polymerase sigma factor, sigma-70 family n=1 Tax=Singulisphaera acidiphila (strain ATCC BAA-1392 / DSM 18658 / VKM B-2454 / MOB10) TaxID=886293 RepID=L0DMP7_SINAD|nr:sigma-70 family RNA polymerase sigma factor [Singulisphaera acidiphila]AGA30100.1 RNA polymerase sigma factor, sigma-70 family [Singulisphaera acidiphila DSM 18658]